MSGVGRRSYSYPYPARILFSIKGFLITIWQEFGTSIFLFLSLLHFDLVFHFIYILVSLVYIFFLHIIIVIF
jgi:hypothetical protein